MGSSNKENYNKNDFYSYKRMTEIRELLKVQSCKLYNNKYMTASTKITNTEIFAFMKLLSRKVLFTNRKRQQELLKSRLLFKKIKAIYEKRGKY